MYQLHSSLSGHRSDVLSLAVTADDCIVSCSRDQSAKLWKSNGCNKFIEIETYVSEQNLSCKFPTSVCVLLPSDLFECGLILVGSNDNNIFIYEPNNAVPMYKLRAHTNAVCKIVSCVEVNVFLSASWDGNVKMWSVQESEVKCLLTIEHPSISVWAVLQMRRKLIVTGSADKLIRVFSNDGRLIRELSGHRDCVRDVVEKNDDEILSCSNDTTVRRWSVNTGECLEILYGHPNYVYCVRVVGEFIFSCGEDRCLLIWWRGRNVQTITLPSRSVWTIGVLSNNDIVTGSSDGVMRVFTTDEKRAADEKTCAEFVAQCGNFQVPFKNPKTSRFIQPHLPGTKDGEKQFFKEGERITCYSWSSTLKKWIKLNTIHPKLGSTKNMKIVSDNFTSKEDENTKSVFKAAREPFVCAVCRRPFTKKNTLRDHIRVNNHSVANRIPADLSSILPQTPSYYAVNFERNASGFCAELCLPEMRTVDDLHAWIRRFVDLSGCSYRRHSTRRSAQTRTHKEFYRCHQPALGCNIGESKKGKAVTTCNSTIRCILKRNTTDDEFFGKINVNFVHTHPTKYVSRFAKPIADVEEAFRILFRDGLGPADALRTYEKILELQSPTVGVAFASIRDVHLPDFDWVSRFYQTLSTNGESSARITAVNECGVDDESTTVDGCELVEVAVEKSNRELDTIDYEIVNLEEMVAEVESDGCGGTSSFILRELVDEFNVFADKLDEDPQYFEGGILSMCHELNKICELPAESRLCALYSFNTALDSAEVSE